MDSVKTKKILPKLILSAHQPAYLPWVGYLHRIAISDHFVILDSVQFEKNSFINRNLIKYGDSELWLTVPVKLKNHLTSTIKDIQIDQNSNWAKKHYKTLCQVYSKSPYFDYHEPFFQDIYKKKWTSIHELNITILYYLLDKFQIKTPISMLSDLHIEGSKQDLILNLSLEFNASQFIFGKYGHDYVDKSIFHKAGVGVAFHDYQFDIVNQSKMNSKQNFSCVDLLFNSSLDELNHHLLSKNFQK